MPHRHEEHLRLRLNGIFPEAYDQLEKIPELDDRIGRQLLAEILGFCCEAQNSGAITAGRCAFGRIPLGWMERHLPEVADTAIDLSEEWEYRRFLETLRQHAPLLLQKYVARGLNSSEAEIRTTAEEFSEGGQH